MTPDEVAAVMNTTFTYHVEIQHPDSGVWNHIHHPDWETSTSYPDAWIYALAVRRDHPGSQVRVVETGDGYPNHHIPVP